jgi:hypothetical protein
MLIPVVLAVPVHIALRRGIRGRAWVLGCCTVPGLLDAWAWIAYRGSVPPGTLPCIADYLRGQGLPVQCEPTPSEVQAALHHAAMLHLSWIVLGVAVMLWVVALAVGLIGRPNLRPPWEPFSLLAGRLPT